MAIIFKITLMKERKEKKERANSKEGGEEKRREESNGFTSSFYNGYFVFGREKKLWNGKGPFRANVAVTKIWLDTRNVFVNWLCSCFNNCFV